MYNSTHLALCNCFMSFASVCHQSYLSANCAYTVSCLFRKGKKESTALWSSPHLCHFWCPPLVPLALSWASKTILKIAILHSHLLKYLFNFCFEKNAFTNYGYPGCSFFSFRNLRILFCCFHWEASHTLSCFPVCDVTCFL